MLKLTRRLLVASHNAGKVREYADILGDMRIDWLTLDAAGVRDEVPETGETFYDNAVIKAEGYARQTHLLTLADDSGLEVDALGGEPGVYSARYGGLPTAEARYQLLLDKLRDVPWESRTARFHCVVALAAPDGTILGTADGVCEGRIGFAPAGEGGFGYDPVFVVEELSRTMAELSPADKHRVSHRGRAAAAIAPRLRQVLVGG